MSAATAVLVPLALAIAALLGLVWLDRRARAERARVQAELDDLRTLVERQRDEIRAQQALAAGLGDHLQQMEKRLRKLEAQRLSLPPTGGKSYDEAVRMLRDGFGDREIIDLCGITQGELALIKNLHRAASTAG